MLMVIFGAGASYDSYHDWPPHAVPRTSEWSRPPLAKELFINIPKYREISTWFRPCQVLFPYLRDGNIEAELEKFRAEAESNYERRKQLTAVKYYLSGVIEACENAWWDLTSGVSNYRTFLDQLSQCPRVCLVTFNYDTLLERALDLMGFAIHNIGDYITHRHFKLFKLHGSINWCQWISKTTVLDRNNKLLTHDAIISAAPIIDDYSIIRMRDETIPATHPEEWFNLPAIAVPTVSKHSFVCPPDQIEELKAFIPEVTQIVIVGWRAGEEHFLKLLKDGLKGRVPVITACSGPNESQEPYERMVAAGLPVDLQTAIPEGFTGLVMNRLIAPLLEASAAQSS